VPITEADLDQLLTRTQAAELLGLSVSTFDRLIREKRIEVIRHGTGRGRPRVTRRAVLDYLNSRRQPRQAG
jgi:excisionase family DNA binding protein